MRILKVGDKTYAQSIQNFSDSYLIGFPQREQFLAQFADTISFTFYHHKQLTDLDSISHEREKFEAYCREKSFDYILIDNPLSSLVLSSQVQIPILFDCIDWYEEMYVKEFGITKQLYLLKFSMLDLMGRAEAVIAQSPVMLESLRAWGLRTNKTIVIPNGYDEKLFFPYTTEKVRKLKLKIEKKHHVSFKDKAVIVYTGKLGKWYDNIKLIADAVTDDQILLIVGDGPIIDEITSRPNVIKCGAVPLYEVPEYTNIADALVFPVDVDCSPIAISEYLAVGKPIIMGRGRMEWLLKDGLTGSMVDNNIYSWQEGIKRSLANSAAIGAYNKNLAKELSWQKLAAKMTNFIENEA